MMQTSTPSEKSFVREYSSYIPKKEYILDLGCGFGGNALFLAEKGFSIEAIDADSKKIQILKEYIQERDLKNIILAQKRIGQFIFRKEYVTIICKNVLHFLEKKEILKIISSMKNHTKRGGLHFICVFTKNGDLFSERMYFFNPSELKALYGDWEILFYEEKVQNTIEKNSKGIPKKHEVASIVARKKETKD